MFPVIMSLYCFRILLMFSTFESVFEKKMRKTKKCLLGAIPEENTIKQIANDNFVENRLKVRCAKYSAEIVLHDLTRLEGILTGYILLAFWFT